MYRPATTGRRRKTMKKCNVCFSRKKSNTVTTVSKKHIITGINDYRAAVKTFFEGAFTPATFSLL